VSLAEQREGKVALVTGLAAAIASGQARHALHDRTRDPARWQAQNSLGRASDQGSRPAKSETIAHRQQAAEPGQPPYRTAGVYPVCAGTTSSSGTQSLAAKLCSSQRNCRSFRSMPGS
jgi:hypothetical protein